MFDAKSILEAMVNGASPKAAPPAAGGGLGDLLGQLGKLTGGAGASAGQAGAPGMGGLEDMLRKMMPGAAGAGGAPGASHAAPAEGAGAGMGGLGDILAKLQQQVTGAPGQAGGGGGLMDILGKVLSQATEGVKEGAGKVGAATGASDALGKAMGGQSPDDILAKLKDLIAQNQLGAGAAAGGLGAIVLGTQTGRGVAMGAAKIGALALIGGLAYKALLNYQAGKPLITGAHSVSEAAPQGSGFEPQAVTNETATLYIRAMIAAAAADGRVDEAEMGKIVGGLKQAGMDGEAEAFIANELNQPASVEDLANACQSAEQAVQVYAAARLAVTPDSRAEQAFLAQLADRLGVDASLAAHVDAAAKTAG